MVLLSAIEDKSMESRNFVNH